MRKVFKRFIIVLFIIFILFAAYVIYYNSTKADRQIKYQQIIQKELKETGKLMVLEGTTQYTSTFEDAEKLLGIIEIGNKTLDLDLQFKYGYSMDLSAIDVEVADNVLLTMDSSSIILDYIYLDVDNSYVESSSSLLVKNYTPQEITDIQKVCVQNVKDELLKNEQNMIMAKSSLENQLKLMIGKIADKQVIVEYKQVP